jgi:pimeloyl-ACP methyl ester carboxylesterase
MQSKVKGAGVPLVLVGDGLTGWLGWNAHAERLSAYRRVVQLQPLCVQWGLEDRDLPPDYTVKTESRAMGAALRALGLADPVDVVGASFGGVIALDFALDEPGRIRTLTLIEPPAWWVARALGPIDADFQIDEAFLDTLRGDISEDQLEMFLSVAGLASPAGSVRDLPHWPLWSRHRRSLRLHVGLMRQRDDFARLEVFDKPVLFVKGTGSSRFLHRVTDALASRLPRAEVVEMPAGHAPQIVSMDRFLETLAAFQTQGT